MKKTFEVKLLNHKFKLKSESDETHVQQVADLVSEKLFQIKEKTQSVASLNVALLASLNLADEYLKLKKLHEAQNKNFKNKISSMIKLIDQHLKES